jgi:hypothetical protein
MEHNKHKCPRISMEFQQSFKYLNNIRWIRKCVKLTKNGKSSGDDNINSELYKYGPEEFKQRLLKFLNNIYTENCSPNQWRNATVIPIFKKGDKRSQNLQRYWYSKIYSKILNMKLQSYTE